MISEPRAFLFGPRGLRVGGFKRSLGDSPLGAHRGLAREQFGERHFRFARDGLERAQLGRDACRMGFRIREPLIDLDALLIEAGNRLCRVALQRFLTRDVGMERSVEPVELGEPARDGITASPRGGKLMRELMAQLPRFGERVAPFGQCGVRTLVPGWGLHCDCEPLRSAVTESSAASVWLTETRNFSCDPRIGVS